jgi:hypothetical protein
MSTMRVFVFVVKFCLSLLFLFYLLFIFFFSSFSVLFARSFVDGQMFA